MQVAPGATYEATVDWAATGVTIGMTVIDNVGGTAVARVTGFTERKPGFWTRPGNTAPGTAGQFTLVFDDDGGTAALGHAAYEDLLVTSDAAVAIATSNLYVTRAELKATLDIGDSYADADIDWAVATASRVIDALKDTQFFPTSGTRYYETDDRRSNYLNLGAVVSVSSVTIDIDGSGGYTETWVAGTDFYLDPPNALMDGIPFTRLKLRALAGRTFPTYQRGVKVTGVFGWAETPWQVRQAAKILAGRLTKRPRETPYGVITVGADVGAVARIARIDPDVSLLLDNIGNQRKVLFV